MLPRARNSGAMRALTAVSMCCHLQGRGDYVQGAASGQMTQQLKTTGAIFFGLRHNLWVRGPVVGKRTAV